ncbi:MAG: hypothetical protein OXC30_06710 [Alphaproteobacteria bacterium]|nr:hypothetical protein [Alphaproteobacteria bacterium]
MLPKWFHLRPSAVHEVAYIAQDVVVRFKCSDHKTADGVSLRNQTIRDFLKRKCSARCV